MFDRIPYLHDFSGLYWNEMGTAAYGNINSAFDEFLDDCCRLPDGGSDIIKGICKELIFVSESEKYKAWLETSVDNIATIKQMRGRFIYPDDAKTILSVLNSKYKSIDSYKVLSHFRIARITVTVH